MIPGPRRVLRRAACYWVVEMTVLERSPVDDAVSALCVRVLFERAISAEVYISGRVALPTLTVIGAACSRVVSLICDCSSPKARRGGQPEHFKLLLSLCEPLQSALPSWGGGARLLRRSTVSR